MLMTVEHLRKFVDTETPDELLAHWKLRSGRKRTTPLQNAASGT